MYKDALPRRVFSKLVCFLRIFLWKLRLKTRINMATHPKSSTARCFGFAIILASGILFSPSLQALQYEYDFNHEFSSGVSPEGSPPWLRATVTDAGANTVTLTLSTVNFSASEFVSGWYFNLNPVDSATSLNIVQTSSSGVFSSPTIQTGRDAFKADGDGKYDMLFSFATSGDRFATGDSVTFTITGINGLQASDFDFLSAPAGGHGPFVAAAHIQGISSSYSGWVDPTTHTTRDSPVPDNSATIVLLGISLVVVEVGRRRLRSV